MDNEKTLAEIEREIMEQRLAAKDDNRTWAAASLGISVRTLQRKLKAWALSDKNTHRQSAQSR